MSQEHQPREPATLHGRPKTHDDLRVDELTEQHPGWQVCYVPRYIGGMVWCARLHDDHKTVINADSPDHLSAYITEREQELGIIGRES